MNKSEPRCGNHEVFFTEQKKVAQPVVQQVPKTPAYHTVQNCSSNYLG